MTYPDNRDHRPIPPSSRRGEGDTSATMWVAGTVAGLALLAIFAFGFSGPKTASTQAGAPASTTGSGSVITGTERPSQPAQPLPNPRAPAAPASSR